MSDNSQIISSVVVDETGTVIVHDARPDNLEEDKFWYCTHRAVIKAACAIQERDSVIPESGVFVSPDEGWDREDVERAQRFVSVNFPGQIFFGNNDAGNHLSAMASHSGF